MATPRRAIWGLVGLALLATVVGGCTHRGPESLAPRLLEGCYMLFGSDGLPVSSPRYWGAYQRMRLRPPRGGNVGVVTVDSACVSEVPRGIWYATADSLTILVPSTRPTLFVFALWSRFAGMLEGRGGTQWDGGPFETSRPATAIRVRCLQR